MDTHGQGSAGSRKDGGLRGGQDGRQHGHDDQPAPRTQYDVLHGQEDVVLVGFVAQPDTVGTDRGVHHHQEGHGNVDRHQDRGRDHGAAAGGGLGRVFGLLVERQARVPAPPVDEQGEQDTVDHAPGSAKAPAGLNHSKSKACPSGAPPAIRKTMATAKMPNEMYWI